MAQYWNIKFCWYYSQSSFAFLHNQHLAAMKTFHTRTYTELIEEYAHIGKEKKHENSCMTFDSISHKFVPKRTARIVLLNFNFYHYHHHISLNLASKKIMRTCFARVYVYFATTLISLPFQLFCKGHWSSYHIK